MMSCKNCHSEMEIIPQRSEMECSKCGLIEELCGVAFNVHQYYRQQNQPSIPTPYDPMKHYNKWIENITGFGRNTEKIPMDRIRQCERPSSIEEVRTILKKLKLTRHNESAVYILGELGGPKPPTLDGGKLRDMERIFSQVVKIWVTQYPGKRIHLPYCIAKIIEMVFEDDADSLKILDFIHLQKKPIQYWDSIKVELSC